MFKRIGNKIYNTETAKELAKQTHEVLYKKRTGEYFLYDKSEEKIIPFTYKQAKVWLRELVDKDNNHEVLYNREFSTLNNQKIASTHLDLSRKAKRKLQRLAYEKGVSITKLVEELIMKE